MSHEKPLRLAIAGLGTVGAEVARIIESESAYVAQRAGRPVIITAVCARDKNKKRSCTLKDAVWADVPESLPARADVDVVVELMGGAEGPACNLAHATLKAGKPLVTANKALLAQHGRALGQLSEQHKAPLYCEAAVAGGIPVIKTLRESLAGNKIHEVFGILNGTCNYILSTMRASGRAFADVLAEAQKMGYAEADPTFDIDGLDAGHKLSILSALAFGTEVNLEALKVEGIRAITPLDITFAGELGYHIKLLGVARMTDKGLLQRVAPYMVPTSSMLAHVHDVLNAVFIKGDHVGPLTLIGRGAGAGPTASSVLSDIIDCAHEREASAFAIPSHYMKTLAPLPDAASMGAFYIRLQVDDKPGVLADMAAILRDAKISIQSLLQKGDAVDGPVPVVLITHNSHEKAMAEAVAALKKLPAVLEPPCVVRILPG